MVFHSRQNFPSASIALPRTSVPRVTLTVFTVKIPGHPSHCKARSIFLHPPHHPWWEGTVEQGRMKWIAQSEERADLGIELHLLSPRAGAKPQAIVCCWSLWTSPYIWSQILWVTSHTHLKMIQHSTAPRQAFYTQAMVNLYYKSILNALCIGDLFVRMQEHIPWGCRLFPQDSNIPTW